MHEYHFLGLVFAYLVVLMLVIGELRPVQVAWEQHDVRAVDMTPWKHARLVGMILLALVLTIYVLFADFGVLVG